MNNSRILIVDDELSSRELCADFLDGEGFDIELAENGIDGLTRLTSNSFELVITDLNMPGMNGLDLLKEVKSYTPYTEVIVMTAFGQIETAVKAMQNGAYTYITKPFSQQLFIATIKRCLEKQRLSEELRRARIELDKRERMSMMGSLAASIAHRMRNPLNIIQMCGQYLHEKFEDGDERKEITKAIEDKVFVLDRIARDFIEYSRAYQLNRSVFLFHDVIEELLDGFTARCKIQQVNMEYQPVDPGVRLFIDKELVMECFSNIVDNALEAMGGPGGIQVVAAVNNDTKVITVEFINTGSVLPTALMERIFEPFFTTKENGTGLGLAIARRVIEDHGGHVMAWGNPKNGTTTVRVDLPIFLNKQQLIEESK